MDRTRRTPCDCLRPRTHSPWNALATSFIRWPVLATLWLSVGCVQQMADQPKLEPLEVSEFFSDGMASRPPIAGTIARGTSRSEISNLSEHFSSGLVNGELARELPQEVTAASDLSALLEHGKGRYEIFCSHCHDLTGGGRGMVPLRGYPEPPTFHSERLRGAPLGHVFRVITYGRGRMPPHAGQISAPDRWAIAAYVRALQLSQHVPVDQLSPNDQEQLGKVP